MPWGFAAAAVGSVASAAIGASASSSAAKTQANAADSAAAASMAQYNQTRADQAPYRAAGNAALNKLQFGLGIGGSADGSTDPNSLLLDSSNFVDASGGIPQPNQTLYANNADYRNAWNNVVAQQQAQFGQGFAPDSNPGAISAEVAAQLGPQIAAAKASQTAGQTGSTSGGTTGGYGDLLRNFQASDFQADPGYQFRLDQGNKAINEQALAAGRYNSGATLKDLDAFNSGEASQEYQSAYDRYNQNQTQQYNKLAGVAGTGQQATNFADSAGAAATGASNNYLTSGAAANAAGTVGTANAFSSAIGSGLNYGLGQQAINALAKNRNGSAAVIPTYDPTDPYSVNSNSSGGWT